MAKKQNGFGNPKSFATKPINGALTDFNRGLVPKAAGVYPSNRRYGSLVQKTIIESYDAESDWIRWRAGYEYYVKAAMEDLIVAAPVEGSPAGDIAKAEGRPVYNPAFPEQDDPELPAYNPQYIPFKQDLQLYSNTNFFLDIQFTGRRFSTNNSDTANHYCLKRTALDVTRTNSGIVEPINMFNVTEVLYTDNPDDTLSAYAVEAKLNNEIWVKGTRQIDFPLIARTFGDRLTDGEVKRNGTPVEVDGTSTEATLTFALNAEAKPAVYFGKSDPDNPTNISVSVLYSDLASTDFFQKNNQDLNAYIGKIGYLPQFYNVKPIQGLTFIDDAYYFEVDLNDTIDSNNESPPGVGSQGFFILDRTTALTPSLYDIAEMVPLSIFDTDKYSANITGKYLFQKSDYQRFFGNYYLTADLVKEQVDQVSYPTLPFIIRAVAREGLFVKFIAEPYLSTLQLFDVPEVGEPGFLVFADYSFTQTKLDTDTEGNYLHPIQGPYNTVQEQASGEEKFAKKVWYKKINNINPYDRPFVKLFTQPDTGLRPATVYACSCPSYSKSILKMPQSRQGPTERKVNRQRNYPLPTAQGRSAYDSIGSNTTAGKMQSWQTVVQRNSFNVCKHSIASMFKDYLKLQEPNTYQTQAARDEYGKKLSQDMKSQITLFQEAYARGGISMMEVIFAMGEGLSYNEVDLAYIVLNADAQARAHAAALDESSVIAQRFGRIL